MGNRNRKVPSHRNIWRTGSELCSSHIAQFAIGSVVLRPETDASCAACNKDDCVMDPVPIPYPGEDINNCRILWIIIKGDKGLYRTSICNPSLSSHLHLLLRLLSLYLLDQSLSSTQKAEKCLHLRIMAGRRLGILIRGRYPLGGKSSMTRVIRRGALSFL